MAENVEMVFWDVQHGHSTYIKTPNNRHIVIDLGIGSYDDRNETFSPLLHLKNNYKIKQLDYVIISHPHLDHIDDILNFDELSPKILMRPSQITNDEVMEGIRAQDRPKFEKFCEITNRYSTAISNESPDNTSNPDNWGGLKIKSFIPKSCDKSNLNNHSIITILECYDIKIVIPGDNEKCSFEELLLLNSFKEAIKDADILLAPHHGRETGYNSEFVKLANPRLTIVSDGRFCETSANGRYSQISRGWDIYKNNGSMQRRNCLTTNSDGEIFVSFGPSSDSRFKSFLHVKTKV